MRSRLSLTLLILSLLVSTLQARVVRVEIASRADVVGGKPFGVKQRWILPDDRGTFMKGGEQEWAEATK